MTSGSDSRPSEATNHRSGRAARSARCWWLVAAGLGASGCASLAGLGDDYVLGGDGAGATSAGGGPSTTTGAGGAPTGTAPGGNGEAGTASEGGVGGVGGAGGPPAGGGGSGGSGGLGGSGGSGGGPLDDVAAALHGARLELPCTSAPNGAACQAGARSFSVHIGGTAGTTYRVRLRVRGVVEQNHYVGGTTDGYFSVGGSADNAGWNIHRLDVPALTQRYFFNHGTTGILHCFSVDYEADVFVQGGANVTLTADALDGQQVRNIDSGGTPIIVPGIPPAPQPFDGQFLQLDVVEVALP